MFDTLFSLIAYVVDCILLGENLTETLAIDFFKKKKIGFIAEGLLQHVHNLDSVKTVPVTRYIEILQNVVLYLFNGGGSEVWQ